MKDLVSQLVTVVLFSASVLVAAGVFLPAFPWSGVVFASFVAALTLWMATRTSPRSTAQTWNVEAEVVRVTGEARRASPGPRPVL